MIAGGSKKQTAADNGWTKVDRHHRRRQREQHHRNKRDIGPATDCVECEKAGNDTRPTQDEFKRYLYWFLDDVPGTVCPFGGKAAYRWVSQQIANCTILPIWVQTRRTVW